MGATIIRWTIAYVFVFTIACASGIAYGQEVLPGEMQVLRVEIQRLNTSITELKKSNERARKTVSEQGKKIESLQRLFETKEGAIQESLAAIKEGTQTQILGINRQIWTRTLLWIALIFFAALFSGASYVTLRKRLTTSTHRLEEDVTKMKETLEAESVKLDSKLMEVFETHFKVLRERPQETARIDHSLALRVGEEIHRMRKRIANMPEDTRGLGALKNSLLRLEDEFNANGYRIIDLLGKPWNDGLTVSARFVPFDDLKPGEQVITKIIRPQINFENVLIKEAEVEVGIGG